jgi:hypothetical protein
LQLGAVEIREHSTAGAHLSLECVGIKLLGKLIFLTRNSDLFNAAVSDAGVFVCGNAADLPLQRLAVLPYKTGRGGIAVVLDLLDIGAHKCG